MMLFEREFSSVGGRFNNRKRPRKNDLASRSLDYKVAVAGWS